MARSADDGAPVPVPQRRARSDGAPRSFPDA
ncbi:putative protein OS=Leifsonia shinshuensis OX=150026 GN=HNR13_003790 PE=4 SV=1 [Leifsonia shinshuensis]|uniref:Uncharacterized protein n=1 Tax=Leifsonia shinshuensis TaxID=150026 RepID=A0A853D057_9MICO|nr:hypothetical protein [Leifsonia shinshuensis]